jgi:hypothetical protein
MDLDLVVWRESGLTLAETHGWRSESGDLECRICTNERGYSYHTPRPDVFANHLRGCVQRTPDDAIPPIVQKELVMHALVKLAYHTDELRPATTH